MITTSKLKIAFSGQTLYENVSIKFLPGNCYGLIGANGSGKSTFLKVLSGELEQTQGDVIIDDGKRIAVLRQDQFAFDEFEVIDTVVMGHKDLYKVYAERKALYAKSVLTEEEGLKIGELEDAFAEMDGYVVESDASIMLNELGLDDSLHEKKMNELEPGQKIRVLLAQALFGNPDILLLDEPTNQLDYHSIMWLENYLMNFKNLVIVVSHDRHFLNKVCTHIADVDYGKIKIYSGNYDFWKMSADLATKQREDEHKKGEEKVKELEEFIRRFSANASKSKQATSRKKLLEKIRPEDLPVSTRKAPFINFKFDSKLGTKVLKFENVSYSENGEQLLKGVNFQIENGDKVLIAGRNSLSRTALLGLMSGKVEPDSGEITWGESVKYDYFPKDNTNFFDNKITLYDWLIEQTNNDEVGVIRGFLGRMLFSGDDVFKKVNVLSGGERARAMFSKIMMGEPNTVVMDEPTDHLDLETISSLNDGLAAYKGCLIFSTQDVELMTTLVNRVIEVSPLGMVDYNGGFEDFIENDMVSKKREKLYLN